MSPPPVEHERSLGLFGSRARILVGAPIAGERRPPALAALEVETMLRGLHHELSRFDPESGLSRLNSDSREVVRTTESVARLVEAARDAAIASGGLVDSSVIDSLERSGYAESRVGTEPADLREALATAPSRTPGTPVDSGRWEQVAVDVDGAVVRRPAGMRIDSGGIGKGLAADLAAVRLAGYSSFAVDCGGDVRIGGRSGLDRPIEIVHPLDPSVGLHLRLERGGIATSGLRTRVWRHLGSFSHHLIDPGSGSPAWTGIVQATAIAPTAVQAETLAKAALLSGPHGAPAILAGFGGVIVLDSGEIEVIGDVPLLGSADLGRAAA